MICTAIAHVICDFCLNKVSLSDRMFLLSSLVIRLVIVKRPDFFTQIFLCLVQLLLNSIDGLVVFYSVFLSEVITDGQMFLDSSDRFGVGFTVDFL